MSLQQLRCKFTKMLALLILYANQKGFDAYLGDVFATSGHSKHSFHYKGLAADLNLFLDGAYLTKTEDHESLGRFWKSIGGTWGGDFTRKDGNHYSLGE